MHSQQKTDAELRRIVKKADRLVEGLLCAAMIFAVIGFFFVGVLYDGRCPDWAARDFLIFMAVITVAAMITGNPKGDLIVFGGIEWAFLLAGLLAAVPFVVLLWGVTTVPRFLMWACSGMSALQKARNGRKFHEFDEEEDRH